MNKANRDQLQKMVALLEGLKGSAESIGSDLQDMADEEQAKFDNMPEGLQQGEAGQAIEAASGALMEAAEALSSGNIGEAIDALEGVGS